jgi:uncharacterized repeat protein (TIGR02543 family)
MKKLYISIIFISLITTSALSQKELHDKRDNQIKHYIEKNSFENKSIKSPIKGEFYLDSTIRYAFNSENDSVLSRKYDCDYNDAGNITLQAYYNWDSEINTWVGDYKYEHVYNTEGKKVQWIHYKGNSQENWIKDWKNEYEYNQDGNRSLSISYNWDRPDEMWTKNTKYKYEYDSNGNRIMRLGYTWDSTNVVWEKNTKYEFEYDTEDNRTLQISYNWDTTNEVWTRNAKYEWEYNTDGNKTLQVLYTWNNTNKTWTKNSKTEYTYNGEGSKALIVGYQWDKAIGEWVNSYKKEYEYNSDNQRTLLIFYIWNSNKGAWEKNWKDECQYDSQGNRILRAFYNWDNENDIWKGDWKRTYKYDSNGNIIVAINYNWNETNSSWVIDYKEFSYYTGLFSVTVNIKPEEGGNINIDPEKEFYNKGEQITFTATSVEGYEFVGWTGDVENINNTELKEVNVTMPSNDISLTANFSAINYTVDVSVQPENAGAVSGDGTYNMDDEVTLEATPNESYKFVNWTNNKGNEVSNDTDYTFTMPSEDVSLIANFDSTQTRIWEGEVSDKIDVYPNPAQENINIKTDNKINRIVISNITGSVVYISSVNDIETRISTDDLDTGIYILRIYTEDGVFEKKLQIQK